ncbi:helix-turn-helix domain-containing protein [Chryseobacterium joostei]|uniref:helix-turn-helix domain-containing protein n=1 Tax=Chryseobacterium joostei TaxID=112234 RepID=UPI003D0CE13E
MNKKDSKGNIFQQLQSEYVGKEILSFKEALAYLDISPSSLYKLTSHRAISYFKPNGGKVYFKRTDLDNWMLQNENKSKELLEEELLTKIKSKKHE